MFSLRYEHDTNLTRQFGEELPPNSIWDPWPGSVTINSDGTIVGGSAH